MVLEEAIPIRGFNSDLMAPRESAAPRHIGDFMNRLISSINTPTTDCNTRIDLAFCSENLVQLISGNIC